MKLPRLIALALIAHLIATPVTSGMLVLCFGTDGHVAVESANSGLCCREWEATHQGDPDDLVESLELASGPCCNDVELSIEAASLTVPAQKVVPTSTVPLSTPVLSVPRCRTSAGTLPLSAESQVAVSLSTVVLRA
jgi:hypothetical protein